VKISLPDVNVLLALTAEGHTHHAEARNWFASQENSSVALCRITQMGLLRLLTNPKVLRGGVCSIPRAWEISNEIVADRRILFAYEPVSIELTWKALMNSSGAGSASWTDTYLAAFAKEHGYTLVTFDHGFRRWTDLSLNLLQRAGG
jgi:toxin-antitoxin system PIN domain toxin